jgi:hypothetical protein
MFWEVNGGYEFACNNCTAVSTNSYVLRAPLEPGWRPPVWFVFGLTVAPVTVVPFPIARGRTNMACTGCLAGKIEYKDNQRFQDKGEPLIYCVAAILPFA